MKWSFQTDSEQREKKLLSKINNRLYVRMYFIYRKSLSKREKETVLKYGLKML